MRKSLLFFCLAALLCSSCETDSYDKGQGEYSLMQADFAELTVNSQKQVVSFLTDEGLLLSLTQPATTAWIQRPDTTYRGIVYFNKVDSKQAELLALGTMPVLQPVEHWRFKEQPQDPVGVESSWLTRNGKYINIGLLLRSGRIDDEEGTHAIALACDTVLQHSDQKRTAYYRLLHAQGDTPEYYTNRRYISILLPQDRPDSVCLSIQTYDGTLRKQYVLQ